MNNIGQVVNLTAHIYNLMGQNNGSVTLHFYGGKSVKVNVLNINTIISVGQAPTSVIKTFTDNINDTTDFDMFLVQSAT